jgi:hypothetical protein
VNYRLSVDFDAPQFLFSLRKADQVRLTWWLERLRNSPFSAGQSIVTVRRDAMFRSATLPISESFIGRIMPSRPCRLFELS